jgi:hypothetical protein
VVTPDFELQLLGREACQTESRSVSYAYVNYAASEEAFVNRLVTSLREKQLEVAIEPCQHDDGQPLPSRIEALVGHCKCFVLVVSKGLLELAVDRPRHIPSIAERALAAQKPLVLVVREQCSLPEVLADISVVEILGENDVSSGIDKLARIIAADTLGPIETADAGETQATPKLKDQPVPGVEAAEPTEEVVAAEARSLIMARKWLEAMALLEPYYYRAPFEQTLEPLYVRAVLGLAQEYHSQNNLSLARIYLAQALQLEPKNPQARQLAVTIQRYQQRLLYFGGIGVFLLLGIVVLLIFSLGGQRGRSQSRLRIEVSQPTETHTPTSVPTPTFQLLLVTPDTPIPFVPSFTPVLDTPTPLPIVPTTPVPTERLVIDTPTIEPATETATPTVEASPTPTSTPSLTPTPLPPSSTPSPQPANTPVTGLIYPAPVPQAPANDQVFTGPDVDIVLSWVPLPLEEPTDAYLVTIIRHHGADGDFFDYHITQETSLTVPRYNYEDIIGPRDIAWHVEVIRNGALDESFSPVGAIVSPQSGPRVFHWHAIGDDGGGDGGSVPFTPPP